MATSSDCGMSIGGSVVIVSKSPTDSLVHSIANTLVDDTEGNDTTTTEEEEMVNDKQQQHGEQEIIVKTTDSRQTRNCSNTTEAASCFINKKELLLCRRFKDTASGILRNCNSLPIFVYCTSPSTRITSGDGVGLAAHTGEIYINKNETNNEQDLSVLCRGILGCPDCLPLSALAVGHNSTIMVATSANVNSVANVRASTVPLLVGSYHQPHTLNLMQLNQQLQQQHQQQLQLQHQEHQQEQHAHMLSHHTPYSNNYPLHHVVGGTHHQPHSHMHSEQTKSLQELQHEVGALLEFRDLVIETFPDLKYKMASMSSSSVASTSTTTNTAAAAATISSSNTLTGSCSLASRREWEPGIRIKRKLSQKDISTSAVSTTTTTSTTSGAAGNATASTSAQQNGVSGGGATATVAAGELSSSSLTRSRSNSHSGKKEPKSAGENNNGSVVQDSGFSTETSSSKEGHSASSNNGAITGPTALNRLSCLESDDELLNLLDVIHRKSNRLKEEMEQLQNYERQNLSNVSAENASNTHALNKSNSGSNALTPKTFREHVERLNKEDIKQLRKERDRLLDKLAEMEAETLTGRIKATQMSNQVEELISVKKDLEEQLKMAMAQKLELNARVQQLQQQQQQQQHLQKSSSSQSSATTVLSAGVATHFENTNGTINRRTHTFQPVVVMEEQKQQQQHASFGYNSDTNNKLTLGRLDGVISTPGAHNTKCRNIQDSKRFAAILLETSVIELQRHLLTLSVQNQVLMQKLDSATKSKTTLAKRLDKSKEQVEDLCFQLEEKNIELAGTQAQLRILETRIHANTPSSGAPTNTSSFMQHSSQHEYETNRSATSTILTLSRRGIGNDSSQYNDGMTTTTAPTNILPTTVTQISTPSMKAMVPLAMDDMQQHGSSTESARDTRQQNNNSSTNMRLMSRSVGDSSSAFEQGQQQQQQQQIVGRVQQTAKKFGGASKPSKIPLPGSKLNNNSTTNYFTGKPPIGRPLSAIMSRSPNSANTSNTSTASSSSNKSSLSRSTGNLLFSKSPNSLKRTDSAQSIRRDAANVSGSSLSTQNSRTSITSSIPLATNINNNNHNSKSQQQQQQQQQQQNVTSLSHSIPSAPKSKRESLTSRVRHLDSLSRVHKIDKDASFSTPDTQPVSSTPKTAGGGGGGGGDSFPATPSNGESQRKVTDWSTASTGSNNGNYMQTLTRRGFRGISSANPTTTPTSTNGNNNVANSARRFSTTSVGATAARVTLNRNHNQQQHVQHDEHKELQQHKQTQQQQSSDNDSGKHSLLCNNTPIGLRDNEFHFPETYDIKLWNEYCDDGFEQSTFSHNSFSLKDAHYFNDIAFRQHATTRDEVDGEKEPQDGMHELLVTFDYGSCSFMGQNSSMNDLTNFKNEIERKYIENNYNNKAGKYVHENYDDDDDDDYENCAALWYKALSKQKLTSAANMHFPVHHVQHAAHLLHDSKNSSISNNFNQFTLHDEDDDDDDDDFEKLQSSYIENNKHKTKCISKDSLENYIINDYDDYDVHEALVGENSYKSNNYEEEEGEDDENLISNAEENFYDSIEGS